MVLELAIVVASCGPFGAPPEGLKAKRTRKWINNQQFIRHALTYTACHSVVSPHHFVLQPTMLVVAAIIAAIIPLGASVAAAATAYGAPEPYQWMHGANPTALPARTASPDPLVRYTWPVQQPLSRLGLC